MSERAAVALHELSALEDGWDGEGGKAPSQEVIDNAFALIDLWYKPLTEVTPNNNGTVSFDWPHSHLEVGRTRFSYYNGAYFIDGTIKRRGDALAESFGRRWDLSWLPQESAQSDD